MQAAARSLPKTEIVGSRPVLFLALQPPLAAQKCKQWRDRFSGGKIVRTRLFVFDKGVNDVVLFICG
jgi:hypothetical protein